MKQAVEAANSKKYSENNEVFNCIRITKELKDVYENVLNIDLGQKITYLTFYDILATMGYLNKPRDISKGINPDAPDDQLVKLSWQTIKTKCTIDEIPGFEACEDQGPFEEAEEVSYTQVECITFENFALLLNLINNVYIKSPGLAKSNNVILEEEDAEKV